MKYIDVHAHVFPSSIAQKVVHSLEQYYHGTWDGTGEIDDLLKSMEESSVSRCVIFSSATKPSQVETIQDYIHSEVQAHPDKFIGFGTLHPDYTDYKREIRRIRDLGMKGLKFHPDFQQFNIDDPAMLRIYEEVGDSLVLLFHVGDRNTDFSSPRRLANVLKLLPGLKIIAAHMGGYSEWQESWEQLIGKDVWMDVSSTMPYLPPEQITEMSYLAPEETKKMILAHGTDRILFASDYPAVHHNRIIRQVLDLGLSDEDNEKIFYRNAEKLLNIKL